MQKILLLLIMAVSFVGCSRPQDGFENSELIGNYLELSTSVIEDPFLIIKDKDTGKYIQFTKQKDGIVYFDLPIYGERKSEINSGNPLYYEEVTKKPRIPEAKINRFITTDEEERFQRYLVKWNLNEVISYSAVKGPSGEFIAVIASFNGQLIYTEELFDDFVQGIFLKVYNLPNYNLDFDYDW